MDDDPKLFFETWYARLTDHPPYPWQRRLFLQLIAADWPQVVDLPTGAGKTGVFYIWLLGLAYSLHAKTSGVPRRLAWVVNRRVVVDQVTKEIEDLLEKLEQHPDLRDLLKSASLSETPLAVSTLRGQYADNEEWSKDPSTPAAVVGTVDMIGSRLLFRGYRSGPYQRPIHTGLLGVDTLIVNDEAHLSPAFVRLLEDLHKREPAARIPGKCFRVMLLSATQGKSKLKKFEHSLDEDLAESEAFRRVFEATKIFQLHEVETKAIDSIRWELATESPAPRTVIFVEKPETAASLAARLKKEGRRVELLTGTMRGLERDRLAAREDFKKFLDIPPPAEPVWLVATSAAEVGVNLTCERMITELAEADHLLQRFGRLNRFGVGEGTAHIVYAVPKKDALVKTLDYLRQLNGNISPRTLWENRPPKDAYSEDPRFARLETRLIEIWAQTTYRDKCVPSVAPWLHGQQSQAPETEIAWRADVQYLTEWQVSYDQIEKVLEQYPVRQSERLHEPSLRILEKLKGIAARLDEAASETRLIEVQPDGSPVVIALTALLKNAALDESSLNWKLLLLPERVGNVDLGMFRDEPPSESAKFDVADHDRSRPRFLIKDDTWTRIGTPDPPETRTADRNSLANYAREHNLKAPLVIRHPVENQSLVYFEAPSARRRGKLREIKLDEHQSAVEKRARDLADKVGLNAMAHIYAKAGALHDAGKDHEVWQFAMGGSMANPLAKTVAPVNIRLINGYRHEFGSLLRALHESDDLLLHLIASHHKGARPCFEARQYDRERLTDSKLAALEAANRYARLQSQFGPWGLAYLEAIFKAADASISTEEGEAASD